MLSIHNIAYYMKLMAELRAAVLRGDIEAWCEAWSETQAGHGATGGEPA
jgi:queuine/archaeosine tRNA-ribosyltransferase